MSEGECVLAKGDAGRCWGLCTIYDIEELWP